MDVRKFENGLEGVGADFKEITDMRMMCEVYSQGRMDEQKAEASRKAGD